MNHDPDCRHWTTTEGNGCIECADCGRVLGPAPNALALTDAELHDLTIEHAGQSRLWDPYPTCSACSRCDCYQPVEWPCTVARLLAEVDRLRELVEHPALGATHNAEDAIVRWTRAD